MKWFLPQKRRLLRYALFTGCFLFRVAVAQEPPAQRVTVHYNAEPLKDALKKMEQVAHVKFVYSSSVVRKDALVSVNADNELLTEVLRRMFSSANLDYEVAGNRIVLKKGGGETASTTEVMRNQPTASSGSNGFTVSGKITNDAGEPLQGASIMIRNSTRGTTSDAAGNYSITAERGDVLVVSFAGLNTIELPVGSQTRIDAVLTARTNTLNDVIVVGYGTQRRKDISGSVASITSRDFRDMPIANLGQALQGRMAGVVVQQASGTPGASPAIRVRGVGSITASSSPLLVVDQQILGNLNDFSFINPNDIERIDVLKDASATAIYGARGSNGVILITTKRGRTGTPRVNLDYYTGFQNVTKKVDMLNTAQWVDLAKEAYANAALTAPAFLNSSLPDYNYQNLIFRTAPMSSYQASVTGGSDKVSYLLSGNFLNQDGIIHNSSFKRYSVRANVDAQLSERIRVGVSLNPTFNDERLVQSDGHWQNYGIINAALSSLPFVDIYKPDGVTYNSQNQYQAVSNFFGGITNPLANIYAINDRQKTTRLLGNVYGELALINGLKYRISFGSDVQQVRRNYFQGSALPQNGVPAPQVASRIAGFFRSTQNINWLFNQTLNYHHASEKGHNFNLLVGTESQKNNRESAATLANNFPNDVVQTVNAGTIVTSFAGFPPQLPNSVNGATLGNFSSINTFFGYFGRLGYNFRQRYLVDFSVRRDGSSRFAAKGRWATFPAASLAWQASEEGFLKNSKLISNLKLKASYGLSGNAAIGSDYASYGVLTAANYNFNQLLSLGLRPQSPDNGLLTWEKSSQFDGGIEMGLLNNRISLTVDYYNRTTKDLLLFTAVPAASGYTNILQNIGSLRNRGLEFGLNTDVLTGAFRWNINANIAFNNSEVLALGRTGDPIFSNVAGIVGNATRTIIGSPLATFYGYRQIGIFQTQEEIDKYAKYPAANQPKPGDRKYADTNNDGLINANDQTNLGNSQPKYSYGLVQNFSYRGFDLAVMLQGVEGQRILNFSRRFYGAAMSPGNNLLAIANNRWRSAAAPGDGSTPRAFIGNTALNNQANSTWVEDASYLNIRNITLGYALPAGLLKILPVRTARAYVGAQNAFIFTKYKGFNAEASGFEDRDPLSMGVDYGGYPQARTITFGLQLGF